MTVYRGGAEGHAPGTPATTGNSDDFGDAPVNVIIFGGALDLTYESSPVMHGARSWRFVPTSGSTGALQRTFAPADRAQISLYFRYDDSHDVAVSLVQVRNAADQVRAQVYVTETDRLRIAGGDGLVFQSAVGSMEPGVWYRIELRVIKGATPSDGTVEAALYEGDSLSPVWSDATTAANSGTDDYASIYFGRCSGGFADATPFSIDSWQVLSGADADGLGVTWPSAQVLIPASDEHVGAWTRSPSGGSLASAIAGRDDAPLIALADIDFGSVARFALTAGGPPGSGEQALLARVSRVGPADVAVTVTLREGGGSVVGGGTVRGEITQTLDADGWVTASVPITSPIGDWTDLYLEVGAAL